MNRIDVRGLESRLASGAIGIALVALVLGQMPSTVSAQAVTDSVPKYDLDAIKVTVLRSPVTLSNSAYPVSVVGQQELRQGKTGMFLEEALRSLPGVQIQNRFNYAVGERVSIRGFGSRAQFGVRGIHVVVDGIPATLPDGQSTLDHVDIGSLGRVEALRGPAAALYGNASGGVLRFTTQIPSQAPAREEATIVGGTDGLLRMQTTTGGTVGSTGYTVSVDRLSYDGFRKVPTTGAKYGNADRLHANARLTQSLAGGQLGITFNFLDLDAENPGALSLALFRADPHQVFSTYTNFQTGKKVRQGQIGGSWTGPVGGLDAEVAVYGVTRDFLNPLPADVVDVNRLAGGARVTLGHAIPGDVGLDIRGGVEVDLQSDARQEFSSNGGKENQLQINQDESVKSLGVFLTTSVTPVERVSVVGGVRYDGFRFAVQDNFPVTPGVNEDDSGKRILNSFSPTVGIHVAVTPDIGVFGNYSKSFETPTTVELGNRESGAGGFNPDLDPQTGRTFEGGVRGTYRNHASFEVSVFNTKLKNELIPFDLNGGLTYYRNAGSSKRNGYDVMVQGQPIDLVSGQVSYTYLNARFEDYVLNNVNLKDKRVPGVSPQELRASVRVGPAAYFLEGNVEYMDNVPVNDTNSAPFTDAYTIWGLRVGANAVDLGRFQISPFAGVNNLGDKTYMSSVTVNAFGGRYYEPGPGREFYVGGSLAISR
jgi:iron complex outermembrane recepter protein